MIVKQIKLLHDLSVIESIEPSILDLRRLPNPHERSFFDRDYIVVNVKLLLKVLHDLSVISLIEVLNPTT